jgi:crotonobetainyl-CoA:carnitine CoA-transferase CaiB-like acyl-CoA transferase
MLTHAPTVVGIARGYAARYALHVLRDLGAEVDELWPVGKPAPAQLDCLTHSPRAVDDAALAAAARDAEVVLTDRLDLLAACAPASHCQVTVELRPPADLDDANVRIARECGIGAVIGEADGPGQAPPGRMLEAIAGLHAVVAALAAWSGARRDGASEHVTVDPVDCLAAVSGVNAIQFLNYGRPWRRSGASASGSGGPYPFRLFPCADGWIVAICRSRLEWASFLDLLGNPPWASYPAYQDPLEIASSHADAVTELVTACLSSRTVEEVVSDARRHRVPLAPMRSVADAVADPRLFHAGDPARPRPPFEVMEVSPRPSPWHPRRKREAASGRRPGPLAGVRVLDLGWVWAAPVAAAWLADLGADVVKVESLERLDVARRRGIEFPVGDEGEAALPGYERAWVFNAVNRNKRSIHLELKGEDDRGRFLELVAASDVVLESFSTGVLERLDLGPDVLFKANPALLLASMGGRTVDGEYVARSYAPMLSALAGIESQVVNRDGQPLGLLNWGVADPNAGTWAALAVVAALSAGLGGRHLLVSQLRALVNTCVSTYSGYDPATPPLLDPPEVTLDHLTGTVTDRLGDVYRRMVHRAVTPETGERVSFQPPWRFRQMAVEVRRGAPLLGSTPVDEVLEGWSG